MTSPKLKAHFAGLHLRPILGADADVLHLQGPGEFLGRGRKLSVTVRGQLPLAETPA